MEILGIPVHQGMLFGPKGDRQQLVGVWPNEGYGPNDVSVYSSSVPGSTLRGPMTKEKFKQLYDAGKAS